MSLKKFSSGVLPCFKKAMPKTQIGMVIIMSEKIDYLCEIHKLLRKPERKKSAKKALPENITGVPDDFLRFISDFGSGRLNNFIWFMSPYDKKWSKKTEDLRTEFLEQKKEFDSDIICGMSYIPSCNEGYPFEFYPEKNGLLPWGYSSNGSTFYLLNENGISSVIVYGGSYVFSEYRMSVPEFIYKLVTGRIKLSGVPDDIFSGEAKFGK